MINTPKKIKIVDGFKVRNTIDLDFGCIEDALACPYIPADEIWFDKAFINEKDTLMATFVRKRALMKKYGYEKAKQILRKDMKGINPDKVKIKLLEKRWPLKIYLVSGRLVREYFDFNFVFGGHYKVYDYVPKYEVWIDNAMLTKERKYVLIHELYELNLMKKGKSYNDSHDYACAREKEERRRDGVAEYLKD
ncbi:MAG: hypothetical protein NTW66_01140 [Candidatus Magasanikbacteria bacterium]|nr:hypothetical protein [Candidatus Magasanikbacteria bacterium]